MDREEKLDAQWAPGMELPASLRLPLEGDGGCMAKLPARELEGLLQGIDWGDDSPRVLVGLGGGDDAGVYLLNEETGLVLTTDFFPPLCAHPYRYGEIAAVNALSDVYAMGGEPLAALNISVFPATGLPLESLRLMLKGGAAAAHRAGVPVVGGHTITGVTPIYGMAVVGRVSPDRLVRNDALEVGMRLVLTSPLGTGVALAAERVGLASAGTLEAAYDVMLQLNDGAARVMIEYGCRAATDITGFSLAGHAYRMARASGVCIRLDSALLPAIEGVHDLLELGCIPGASFRNADYLEGRWRVGVNVAPWRVSLATDPQTSGGMLVAVESACTEAMVRDLRASGYAHAVCVGEVEPYLDTHLVLE